ncbi:hypothetical protein BV22DRAFT_1036869 [Leucogyrophana mollusca]|uniref:Uncharacterized protein n=1 Tax=Leucogyrophana mollusca TaxID=85980 RepID=A0ACB8BAY2_9AGAM|nr:hypothetical protein BV22DRAFT_1036869 [Leucogyrophana mollusca]
MSTTTVLQEGVQGALACTFLATILFGVTCTQAFYYFHRYTRDLSLVRMTVALVCIFEAVHTALLVNDISHSFKLALSSADSTLSDYIYNGLGVCSIIRALSLT